MDKNTRITPGQFTRNITIMILVVIVLLSGGYYAFLENEFRQLLYRNAEKDLDVTARTIDNHINEVHNLCLKLFNSDIFMELLQKDVSMLQEIAALASLREHKNFNDFVHSVTLYSPASRRFYAHSGIANNLIMEYDDYFDLDLISMIRGGTELSERDPRPISRVLAYQKRGGKSNNVLYDNVLTYVFSGFRTVDPASNRFVIINVPESYVTDLLNDFAPQSLTSLFNIYQDQQTLIVNGHGMVVSGTGAIQTLSNIKDNPDFAFLFKEEADGRGLPVRQINGSPALILQANLVIPDWQVVRIIPYASIQTRLTSVRNNFILVLLILFVLGIVASECISRLLYRPISNTYRRMFSLEEENQLYFGSYEKQAMLDILHGSFDFQDSLNEKIKEKLLLSDLENRDFVLLCFSLSTGTGDQTREREMLTQLVGLIPVIRETLCPDEGMILDTLDDDVYVLVVCTECFAEAGADTLDAKLSVLQNMPDFRLNLNMSVSETGRGLGDLPGRYTQARQALQYYFYKGRGMVCRYQEVLALKTGEPVTRELEEALVKTVSAGDKDNLREGLARVLQIYQQHTINDFLQATVKLAYYLKNAFQYMKVEEGEFSFQVIDRIMANPLDFGDVYRLESALAHELSRICDAIIEQKMSRYKMMCASVAEYIQEHFSSPDIGLSSLAELYGLSPSYLERLFVSQTGIAIPDMIKKLRIEKACDLLKHSDIPVEEISSQVGYLSVSNFYKTFRKMTGETPAGYRKSAENSFENC